MYKSVSFLDIHGMMVPSFFGNVCVCVGITIVKLDNTCHSQHHGTLSLSPFLSIYVSLWLQDTCHLMPFTKQHNAYAWVVTSILFLINLTFHTLSLNSSYKIHQPVTDYFLRLPYSELLEKRLFRSRAIRRLVFNTFLTSEEAFVARCCKASSGY